MFNKMSVKEINEFINNIELKDYLDYINILRLDSRKSVASIAMKLAKKLDSIRKEESRIDALKEYEREAYNKGYKLIAGIDEAGRGPLAGPVVAASVVFGEDVYIEGIDDSKKLSEGKREELFEIIKATAIEYSIGIVDHEEIDNINILQATFLAMKNSVIELPKRPDYLLIDAVTIPNINIYQKPIIKGDSKSISIAAASILAKVTRDKIMREYDDIYPEYGFSKHKGYGTSEHYEAIRKNGISSIHRKTFLKSIINGD